MNVKTDYTLSDFDFALPESLIAQYPKQNRVGSRLLNAETPNQLIHQKFSEIISSFNQNDVLVINNTKVIKARIFGEKTTGGKLEILVERIQSGSTAICMIKSSRSPTIGQTIYIAKKAAKILSRNGQFFIIELNNYTWEQLTEESGHIPLPPYIDRKSDNSDNSRYQTVYAKHKGAVAAPTAGLHFDQQLLNQLKDKGVEIIEITLHVGAGTFQPVKAENLNKHQMHYERYHISETAKQAINNAIKYNKRITAVGTTCIRTLESAGMNGTIKQTEGDTNLFIRPGFEFNIVDRLITNFHLPKSSLVMLVSAFYGYENIRELYQTAIQEKYRFFSYGDAMLLSKQ